MRVAIEACCHGEYLIQNNSMLAIHLDSEIPLLIIRRKILQQIPTETVLMSHCLGHKNENCFEIKAVGIKDTCKLKIRQN